MGVRLNGRREQAARNDTLILAAARAIFTADPSAPIATVAERAGVGISALYRRYRSKDELLQRLVVDGLSTYIAAAEAALARRDDPWRAFADFLHAVVAADTHALTRGLGAAVGPTEALRKLDARARELTATVFAQVAPHLRPGIVGTDLDLILAQLAAIPGGDEGRARQLRARYLALFLDAIRHRGGEDLPGPPPRPEEFARVRRWQHDVE